MSRLFVLFALLLPGLALGGSLEIGAAAAGAGVAVTSDGVSVDPATTTLNVFSGHLSATSGPAGTVTLALVTDSVTTSSLAAGTAGASGAELANSVSNVSGNLTISPVTNLIIQGNSTGTFAIRDSDGISLQLDVGGNGSTLVPAVSSLTVDVDGSGTLSITAGDTLAVNAITSTTSNSTITVTGAGTGGVSIPDLLEATSAIIPQIFVDKITYANQGANASSAGQLQRNGANLSFHDATAARNVILDNSLQIVTAPAAGVRGNLHAVNAAGTAQTTIDEGTATDQFLASNGTNALPSMRALVTADVNELLALTDLTGVSATTGTGTTVPFSTSPTISTSLKHGGSAGAPAGVVVGEEFYDTTSKSFRWKSDAGALRAGPMGAFFQNNAATADVTGAAEAEFDSNAQVAPGNDWLNVSFKKFRAIMIGTYTAGQVGQTMNLRFRLNSTSLLGSRTITLQNETNATWKCVMELVVLTTGGSGTIFGTVHSWFDSSAGLVQDMSGGTSAGFDLTSDPTIKITADFGTDNASEAIRINSIVWEEIP